MEYLHTAQLYSHVMNVSVHFRQYSARQYSSRQYTISFAGKDCIPVRQVILHHIFCMLVCMLFLQLQLLMLKKLLW